MLSDPADLFRLVYRSRCTLEGSAEELNAQIEAIVENSCRRNAEAGITGALMHTRRFFVQALEGPANTVEATFDRICCDHRHDEIEVVECSPILERGFGDWLMRRLVPDAAAGLQLDHADDVRALSETAVRAMKLMAALTRSVPPVISAGRRPSA